MRSSNEPATADSCSVEGCDQQVFVASRQLCRPHYNRWQRHGDPLGGGLPRGSSTIDRFDLYTDKSGECWLWTGSVISGDRPYGLLWDGTKQVLAHRWSYEHFVVAIPGGAEIDHLCRVPRCVRPDHLEPVTHRLNVARGVSPSAANASKDRCPRGHKYDSIVKARHGFKRVCKRCRNQQAKRRYAEGYRSPSKSV